MLYSKTLWALVAVVVIGGVLFFLFKKSSNDEQLVADAISILKQGDDRSRDCEAFGKLEKLASVSKTATLMLGEIYARGMCPPFDLEKSIEWFKKAHLSNEEIGSALFHAARWEIPPSGASGPSKDQLMALLSKAKELGYRPGPNELKQISPEYASVFQ